jgi:hypothetical protein
MSVRWKLAAVLDKSSRFCWADLCSWAAFPGPNCQTLRDCMTSDRCAADREADGSCYCGKFLAPDLPEGTA